MHALRAHAVFEGGINWTRVVDLTWALSANLAIWLLIFEAPSVFRGAF